jgi:hypothetical protein
MKPASRDALLTAIAKAREWIDDIAAHCPENRSQRDPPEATPDGNNSPFFYSFNFLTIRAR